MNIGALHTVSIVPSSRWYLRAERLKRKSGGGKGVSIGQGGEGAPPKTREIWCDGSRMWPAVGRGPHPPEVDSATDAGGATFPFARKRFHAAGTRHALNGGKPDAAIQGQTRSSPASHSRHIRHRTEVARQRLCVPGGLGQESRLLGIWGLRTLGPSPEPISLNSSCRGGPCALCNHGRGREDP